MSIIVWPCAGCGTLTVVCQTKSASLTKCGFNEFGTPSSPPKVYRTGTQTGTISSTNLDGCLSVPGTTSTAWAGALTYARGTCATTDTRTVTNATTAGSCSTTINATGGPATDCGSALYAGFGGFALDKIQEGAVNTCPVDCLTVHCLFSVGTSSASSTTVLAVTATNSGTSGAASVTLSDEYTTSNLFTDTQTALSSASWSGSGSCSSSVTADYLVSGDEKTISLSAVKYLLSFPAAIAGSKYFYDLYVNGVYSSTGSVGLSAGQTTATFELDPGVSLNSTQYLTNFRIAAC